jgi:resuscitation-promoting factor RpfB
MAVEKKTWEQMTKGERIGGIIALCIAVVLGVSLIGGFVSAVTGGLVKKESSAEVQEKQSVVTYGNAKETEAIPFKKTKQNDPDRDQGTSELTTIGVNGVRSKTYRVTYVDGKETGRELTESEITKVPIDEVTSVGARAPYTPPTPTYSAPPQQQSNCDPNYSGCVPIASDVDCAGGSGNGPAYVSGSVQVIGSDIYDLDRDGNGVACE